MSSDSWLICPVARPARQAPAASEPCSLCGVRVALSPYDVDILREHAELVVVCAPCAASDERQWTESA